jgi:hypothetical protein
MEHRRLASSSSSLPLIEEIGAFYGTLSVLIIVSAVFALDSLFHYLHKLAHETPFDDIVIAIRKELMVVGGIAFIFKCIVLSSSFIPKKWLLAMEFVGKE